MQFSEHEKYDIKRVGKEKEKKEKKNCTYGAKKVAKMEPRIDSQAYVFLRKQVGNCHMYMAVSHIVIEIGFCWASLNIS